jgi:uncharacterized circularly permuted ATP-grasp superfamily protein/uncharacterized alpha-E superfamily protein
MSTQRDPAALPLPPPLLAGIDRDPLRYQELFDGDAVRPHWRELIAELERATPLQMRHRQQFVARQVRENGITYNVYSDARDVQRPWDLDLLPQLVAADEWPALAAGIAQRASLLNAVLADLYGPQQLLRSGMLPAELIFGHNNFLLPCQGIAVPGGTYLHVYAADLARAPNGAWWVVADRTQAPSGAGYALENRQIISRAFPDLYRQLQVRPLDGFFGALQACLQRLAPSGEDAPLSVLLTPGRFNETYFEHVYLARQLGVPLVEGHDLSVRDARVYMKTLGGLQRVHAILRRLDDDYCDPLELRSDSALGVPGLMEAVRAGHVVVANALGSGVVESPGLLGFLPRICEALRGETLALPSLATWWCGEQPVRQHALERLSQLVIKAAFPSQHYARVDGSTLDAAGLAELRARIEARPHAYVAQEQVKLSQTPVWQRGKPLGNVVARAVNLRVYAVATADGYQVMPGGLTRVAAKADAATVSMQSGGGSKDTWVLADASMAGTRLLPRVLGVRDVVRKDSYLPSRQVENLYWLGRYSERSDNLTRLLRALLARFVDHGGSGPAVACVLDVARARTLIGRKPPSRTTLVAAVHRTAVGSLRDTLARLYWSATQVRGRLSQENWRAIVEIHREQLALTAATPDLQGAMEFLDALLMSVSALSGFALDDMTRDDGWRFLRIGRQLERLQFLADVIARVLQQSAIDDPATLESLLELADSTITYRLRYLSAPQLIPVLDLVLLDGANPHSLSFQFDILQRELGAVAADYGDGAGAALQGIGRTLLAINLRALEHSANGIGGRRAELARMATQLTGLADCARKIAEQLALKHFAHVDDVSQSTLSA